MSRRGSQNSDDGQPSQRVVLAGTLLKKHANSKLSVLGKQFDKRFFILTHDFLVYRHSPMDDDPNEKSFDIRHLMSVTKLGSKSIELRFTERSLVIKCPTDEEYERWYKALDLVRFQPLPYEVENKQVPVPQIVPPIVPRMPVTDAEIEDHEGEEQLEDGEDGTLPVKAGLASGRMRTSSLLEREIADRIAQSGVDPLVPPKFLKRLSQGSLDVMMTTANAAAMAQHNQHQQQQMQFQGENAPPPAPAGNYAKIRDPLASGQYQPAQTMPVGVNGGRRAATTGSAAGHMHPDAASSPRSSSPQGPKHQYITPSPAQSQFYHAQIQQQLHQQHQQALTHQGSFTVHSSGPSKTRSLLPLPELEGSELSPRSRLAKASNAAFVLNGTLPSEDVTPSSFGAAGAAAGHVLDSPQAPPLNTRHNQPAPKVTAAQNRAPQFMQTTGMPRPVGFSGGLGLRPLAGRLSDDGDLAPPPPATGPSDTGPAPATSFTTDENESFYLDNTPGKGGSVPVTGSMGSVVPRPVASAGPRPRGNLEQSSLELVLDEDGPRNGPLAAHPRPSPAPQSQAVARAPQDRWLEEDFDSEEEARGHQGGGDRSSGPRNGAVHTRAPHVLAGGGQSSSGPVVPKPPSRPRPQDSFARPIMPQAPSASRPESRTGSDFRKRRVGSSSNMMREEEHPSTKFLASESEVQMQAPPSSNSKPSPAPPPPQRSQGIVAPSQPVSSRRAQHNESILEDWDDE